MVQDLGSTSDFHQLKSASAGDVLRGVLAIILGVTLQIVLFVFSFSMDR